MTNIGRIDRLILKDIRKVYKPLGFSLAVDNLEFNNVGIHAIVGSNGSGKSTLIRIISLLNRPDSGSIVYRAADGRRFYGDRDRGGFRKEIGVVMQSPYLFNTDVLGNIGLGMKIRGYTREAIYEKSNAVMSALNIGHLAKRRVNELSGGEYRKVAIAQILAIEPALMLMDEPTSGIDEDSLLLIEETIKKTQRETGSIVIMTTHSLPQAHRMSGDIIFIKDGRILKYDIKDLSTGHPGTRYNLNYAGVMYDRI